MFKSFSRNVTYTRELISIFIYLFTYFRTLARSLEPVVTECKEHTIRTQLKLMASRHKKKYTHKKKRQLAPRSPQKRPIKLQ